MQTRREPKVPDRPMKPPARLQGNGEASPEEGEAAGSSQALAGTAGGRFPGLGIRMEKLADYDYMMQNFYSIHPTTTAGRELMDAEHFLSMDLSLGLGNGQDGSTAQTAPKEPQILIYHTHSQETFSDYPENPEATITGVGAYLSELLEGKGYSVIHDDGVYDYRDGKLGPEPGLYICPGGDPGDPAEISFH